MDLYDEIEKFFSKSGILSERFDNYEFRQSQLDMAISILDTLENKSHIFIEAPTGIGKSFAYLVPAIYFALRNKRKAIISTHTINLQEQLIYKDIPLLHDLLAVDFKAALLKGKSNYICPKRLRYAIDNSNLLFQSDGTLELDKLYKWSKETIDGTISDVSFPVSMNVWNTVCAERGICTNKTCGGYEETECFYQKAKYSLADSDLIIVNHHLFFTLLNGAKVEDSKGYLYKNDFVIFDEAQTLETVAAEHFVPALSREIVKYHLSRLYNDKRKKGFLLSFPSLHIIPVVQNLLDINQVFFQEIKRELFKKEQGKYKNLAIRITEKNLFTNHLRNEINKLINQLRGLRQFCKSDLQENELQDYIIRFGEFNYLIDSFLELKDEDKNYVYWVELASQKPDANISLCASPIDLSGFFREFIFRENNSCILTSATLTVNNNFDYFKNRLGAENAADLRLPTQFDFYNQVKMYIPKDIPEPQKETNLIYQNKLAEWIYYFIKFTEGKALILFTNSIIMKSIAGELKDQLNEENIELLIQGEGVSRKNLLSNFKNDINSVLFGLESFWLGVDVPGEALSNLIITRLPFQVPDHPLIQARLEYIDTHGGNSFMDYSLPEAILKFRQGFGRLIRHRNDAGIIVLLDPRILTKPYGKYFLNSVEEVPVEIL
jgi:ATP-dependent DNA helicase DinG